MNLQQGMAFLNAACDRALRNDRTGQLLDEARAAADSGDIARALQAASDAHRACPSFGDASVMIGCLLLYEQGQREAALTHFRRAAQYNDWDPIAAWHLMVQDVARSGPEEALETLREFPRFGQEPLIGCTRASLLHQLGRHGEAVAAGKEAVNGAHPLWSAIADLLGPWEESDALPANADRESLSVLAEACSRILGWAPAPAGGAQFALPFANRDLLEARVGRRIVDSLHDAFLRLFVAPGLFARLHGSPLAGQLQLPSEPAADPDMVLVPAGVYKLGSSVDEAHNPVREVSLRAPLLIDRYPVTHKQWRQFDPSHTCPRGGENHPVAGMTALQAELFARTLGKRLPTEAEWEIAARGPESRVFPWGDKPLAGACNSAESRKSDFTAVTEHPTGASFCGALDMVGNLQEWTASWIGQGDTRLRITKGGDHSMPMTVCRPELRNAHPPMNRELLVGFRCVRDF